MTIDDENSIYVGGLPYDSTEETLREAFHYYGSVVAVKIINDREVGGKCYGFVTFTNPKSADNAIHEMNGRTIGGRVIRVNEVRARGGRPNFHRENFRRDSERDAEWDRGRDRDRNYDHDRDRYHDRYNDRSRDRDREREYERSRDHDRTRDRFLDLDRDRELEDNEQKRNRSRDRDWDRDHDLDQDHDREIDGDDLDRTKDTDKDPHSRIRNDSRFSDRHSRELSSNSSDDYYDQVKEQLDASNQRHEELQKEISQIEEKIKEKEQLVSNLRKKSLKVEDALATAKKLSSHRQMQLTNLQRCFLQVKDYNGKLKASEQELQALVDATMIEASMGDDAS
ncbi:serine/threonine-protein kinase fray2-like isoform X1 [Macadamia integrifolia]|uniref:serine/threonine-protein kinase fray2-like isoform X1 n=1 Tax=Macadamia integrifolia TaxID=60698 RepID=UPI001C4FB128|nr:serine/threonine-protein kinase fray2-like isoform X1 [Macadamia integrifolia]